MLKKNISLSNLTTLKIGGRAKYFLEVKKEKELLDLSPPFYVIGLGSNLVVSDKGYNGLVVKSAIEGFEQKGNLVTVGGGNKLLQFIFNLNKLGLSGLEKMAGIPGAVAGAIFGNAGAYGQEIKDHLIKVKIYDASQNKFYWLSKKECQFGYRDSIFKKHKNWIITGAQFRLKKSNPKTLAKISRDIIKLREQKYHPGLLCPGSFFKNIVLADLKPQTREALLSKIDPKKVMFGKVPAGYLLEQVGAKGMQEGGIKVASYHGNLFYNTGKGKASGIQKLAVSLKNKVKKEFGIELEEEIQYLG
ncbi:UDP-N-acetylmuramate dehydrogenase [Candidatus Berkelbacteria bacterium]|nr:UDP-N-acetylmuramate dehydrogenase [Candidatus Berkelbacteria bacterium]